MIRKRTFLPLLAALMLLGFFIALSGEVTGLCAQGLRLCAETIIPSLFPFFVLCSMLNELGLPGLLGSLLAAPASVLYGISGAGASALFIGLTGGYPLGASYIARMERSGAISASEGERLLGFCNNSGPAFIVGAVGAGVYGSAKIGLILYFVHIISALITGFFMRSSSRFRELQPIQLDNIYPSLCFTFAVKHAAETLLSVCGFIVFFSLIAGLLDYSGLLGMGAALLSRLLGQNIRFTRALLTGLIELGSGVGAMRGLEICPENLALSAFLLGFGSLSVHIQTKAVLHGSKIKGTLHFAGHLLSASVGAMLAYLIALFL